LIYNFGRIPSVSVYCIIFSLRSAFVLVHALFGHNFDILLIYISIGISLLIVL
jgi:hypothetical protein